MIFRKQCSRLRESINFEGKGPIWRSRRFSTSSPVRPHFRVTRTTQIDVGSNARHFRAYFRWTGTSHIDFGSNLDSVRRHFPWTRPANMRLGHREGGRGHGEKQVYQIHLVFCTPRSTQAGPEAPKEIQKAAQTSPEETRKLPKSQSEYASAATRGA